MMRNASRNNWWSKKPRRVTILNDTIGWATPWCVALQRQIQHNGDQCRLVHDVSKLNAGDVAFFLGCTQLVGQAYLKLHRNNLVVHASALPKGRGFSPLKWQICEGTDVIPLTLFEALEGCDEGDIYFVTQLQFGGHELLDEMQNEIGKASNLLCMKWLNSPRIPKRTPQNGQKTSYGRRNEEHQRLNPNATIIDQFKILRTVDNNRFPAFFDLNGYRYEITIKKSVAQKTGS